MARPDPGAIPLALYVHVPWCVRKCPYCDFNSHAAAGDLPAETYVDALLDDLDGEVAATGERTVETVFIGGGTPSLLPAAAVSRLLAGIAARVPLADGCEVTLEANPGTLEAGRFEAFREAGVNRLSIGVQSLDDGMLAALGRIHSAAEAAAAVQAARAAGFASVNLDLMFGLPGQDVAGGRRDVAGALALEPDHISFYQLTLEPNTLFHARPPALPSPDTVAELWDRGREALERAGYAQYEVSAYARSGRACRHNLNYWSFGDYAGIGAGAHGKLTAADGRVVRKVKQKHPAAYLRAAGEGRLVARRVVAPADLPAEFMMNALRLRDGVPRNLYAARTGLDPRDLRPALERGVADGLLEADPARLRATDLGYRFLDRTVGLFLN